MKWLQKLGKSLMLPVAVLPVAGILSGIGYWLCPAVMQGGEITGAIPMIGYFLTQAALALIDGAIIALLFAVGVAVGMSDDHDGTAGLAGLVSWLMITHLLSPGVVQTLAGIAPDSIQGMAFAKIQNALIGIIAGVIGASLRIQGCRTGWRSFQASVALQLLRLCFPSSQLQFCCLYGQSFSAGLPLWDSQSQKWEQ